MQVLNRVCVGSYRRHVDLYWFCIGFHWCYVGLCKCHIGVYKCHVGVVQVLYAFLCFHRSCKLHAGYHKLTHDFDALYTCACRLF